MERAPKKAPRKPVSEKECLEQMILGSPEVQGLMDKLAGKKLELGRNPVKAAFWEQLRHIRYHVDAPFTSSERGKHPEIVLSAFLGKMAIATR